MQEVSIYIAACYYINQCTLHHITQSHGESLLLSFIMVDMTNSYPWTIHTWLYYPTYCRLSSYIPVYATGLSQNLVRTSQMSPDRNWCPLIGSITNIHLLACRFWKKTWNMRFKVFLQEKLMYRLHSDNFPWSRIFEIFLKGFTHKRNVHSMICLMEDPYQKHTWCLREFLSGFLLPHKQHENDEWQPGLSW